VYSHSNAAKAYQMINNTTVSGRETEARVLSEAADKLKHCIDNWNASSTPRSAQLDEALRYNQRIWSMFQSDLASETHPLPKQLREEILSLSVFIDKRIFEVMAYPNPDKLKIIVKINRNLAAGLRGSIDN
jgi:flagellar protein FlaF